MISLTGILSHRDFSKTAYRKITLSPVNGDFYRSGSVIFSSRPISTTTDANGCFTFGKVVEGEYYLTGYTGDSPNVSSPTSPVIISIPTGSGVIGINDLLG